MQVLGVRGSSSRRPLMPNRLTASCLIAALSLVLAGSARGKTADPAEPKLARPGLPPIESLQLEPASLTLLHGRDGRAVLVWGVAKDGQRFDLTDDATLKSESAGVTIGKDRYINPAAAGETSVT